MTFKQDQIVIIGANGQLGSELTKLYPGAQALSSKDLDITDSGAVSKFNWLNTKVIINAAAWTNVDEAEKPENQTAVWSTNFKAVEDLATIANQRSAILIHISSDYVFDGHKTNHSETEPFSPLNNYGKTKAAGDIAAQTAKKHYILRSSWVVGTNSSANNFVKTIFKLGQKNTSLKIVNDQFGRLTFTSEIARAINHLLINSVEFGVYNLSNSGEIKSWAEIAKDIYSYSGISASKISGISTADYNKTKNIVALRPTNSDLCIDKIINTGFKSRAYAPLLEQYVQELSKESS